MLINQASLTFKHLASIPAPESKEEPHGKKKKWCPPILQVGPLFRLQE